MKKRASLIVVILLVAIIISGCATVTGGLLGAVIGGAVDGPRGARNGILIGAGTGAVIDTAFSAGVQASSRDYHYNISRPGPYLPPPPPVVYAPPPPSPPYSPPGHWVWKEGYWSGRHWIGPRWVWVPDRHHHHHHYYYYDY